MNTTFFFYVLLIAEIVLAGNFFTKAIDNTNACGPGHYLGCTTQTCINDLLNQTYFNSKCLPVYNGTICNSLWISFSAQWINITDPNILALIQPSNYSNYNNFFNWTSNRGMFWSGTGTCGSSFSDVVHDTAKALGYETLESTIPVSFVNEHHFCDPTLFVNGSCINGYVKNSSTNGSEQAFFISASVLFAENTYGDLAILISPKGGTNPPQVAYSNQTIFHNNELPNINATGVTSFTVFAYTDWRLPGEYCGNKNGFSSIDQLINDAQNHFPNVPVLCYNDPPCILKVICKFSTQANRTNYNNKVVCCEQVFDDTLLPNSCTMNMDENFCANFQQSTSSFPVWGTVLIVIFSVIIVVGVVAILYWKTNVFKKFRKPSTY